MLGWDEGRWAEDYLRAQTTQNALERVIVGLGPGVGVRSNPFSGAFAGPRSIIKVKTLRQRKVGIPVRAPAACGEGWVTAFVPMTDWETHIKESSCSSAIACDCHMGTWDECY